MRNSNFKFGARNQFRLSITCWSIGKKFASIKKKRVLQKNLNFTERLQRSCRYIIRSIKLFEEHAFFSNDPNFSPHPRTTSKCWRRQFEKRLVFKNISNFISPLGRLYSARIQNINLFQQQTLLFFDAHFSSP